MLDLHLWLSLQYLPILSFRFGLGLVHFSPSTYLDRWRDNRHVVDSNNTADSYNAND